LAASEFVAVLLGGLVTDGVNMCGALKTVRGLMVFVEVIWMEQLVLAPARVRRGGKLLLEGDQMPGYRVAELLPVLPGLQLGQQSIRLDRQPRQVVMWRVFADEPAGEPPPQVILNDASAHDNVTKE
jgi:hypothetical protein